MSSIQKRPNGSWRARYRDEAGNEHARHFPRKIDAQTWLDEVTASVVTGTYRDPKTAKLTMGEWCRTWLKGYEMHRPSTVRQARSHIKHINAAFGDRLLSSVRPSEVKAWTVQLRSDGLAVSTVYALHARLSHIFSDAVHDGLLTRSPVSRRTSPGAAKQRAYVATTAQIWALHDAMPEGMRPVILLGAFAGLRVGEIAALRVTDVDLMRGIISPTIQYPSEPLKTETSKLPVPIPIELCLEINRVPAEWESSTFVVGAYGRPVAPYTIETAFRAARATVEGLPDGFRIHDLRHYYASLLIASGLDVKVVQARMRHASATTTLNTYSHLWPDKDESARAAVKDVFAARADSLRTMPATSVRSSYTP
ncbi:MULTISPECIES: site-specific integrase [unclassified Cryobacterium]|uniref:tyrosine-type recombinase/integrase n=1 Tax=unclassified Cryobacterium TaxID=2649013 RepID=UPI00106A9D9F|nr:MULTISPECIES: site-specific integrase [unclassified Cryobacterium]TFC00262.1 site-specific integrase [Cryobacterium sp. MDB2-A-1]TFC14126.1 site-specific integrase [Cryobacterium sp. MDB2-A-2]